MTEGDSVRDPLLGNARKLWVEVLMQHRPLERAAGGALGELLGCGRWGCVVDIVGSPYVLKLTVDPTEAHVWAKIVELIESEGYGADGFPRIKKIFKLEPGIPYGRAGRSRKAYGIVQEALAPVFTAGTYGVELTEFTKRHLGLGSFAAARVVYERLRDKAVTALPDPAQRKVKEFIENIEAVDMYREAALDYHDRGFWLRPGVPRHVKARLRAHRGDTQKATQAAECMGGTIGAALGESLSMLASNEVILNDVHVFNLGWRFLPDVEGIEGYTCLVLFDPGRTPTDRYQLPVEKWR